MLNAETPRLKFAVYGAHDDLGSALLVELLSRQHEAVALLDDLNSLSARPGLRTKPGDLFDPLSVSESVAGMDAVICLYHTPRLPSTDAVTGESPRRDFYQAVEALLLGLQRVGVERLLLIADFPAIERQPEVEAALQRLAAHPLDWTLVDAPPAGNQLTVEALAEAAGKGEANPYRDLQRIAAGIVDELERPQHLHQRIHFRS
ncbi:NADH-flavin reductase [Stutzerimonas frequens]|jgi:putative NADH-flavin reductase|uniref:NAD(P)-dependent oxidoreductase n=1 Tax=Stutzerimonas stutzeri group TaxID=136846 RepID=UPI000D7D8A67|nr:MULTISPECIES: NAD(P)H-binding protein [Stutzerimonas stutzeri group]AWT12153.1 NADH-flavin reductase [Stutzerimonas frequens]MBK3919000.1 NAD(P)H-binding protein [Stutzerimonas frequens]MBS9724992.1 NAD(P)H-binding protein [Stutzerimonas stutzeri]WCR46132.1 NAD(P)H-binding protein [Stutzerimonas stutzeri]WRW27168.1 NAD(P)H-binding protein [Stutzerimonas frequens]